MKLRPIPCGVLSAILLLSLEHRPHHAAARGHHATASQFDISRILTLRGTVSKLEWGNPHAHVFLTVHTARGSDQRWDVELGSPGAVIVSGLSRDLLKPGASMTITGYPGKAGDAQNAMPSLCATEVMLPNGILAKFVVGI